jgi:hypothetical protein
VLSPRMVFNIMYVSRSSAYLIILVFSGRLSFRSLMKIRNTVEYQILDRVLKNENSFFRTPAYLLKTNYFQFLDPI